MLSYTVQLFWPIQGKYGLILAQTVSLLNPQSVAEALYRAGKWPLTMTGLDRFYMATTATPHP